jgi:hypothetical protein
MIRPAVLAPVPADGGRQLELDTLLAREVHRIPVVLPSQLPWNLEDVVEHVILIRQAVSEVSRQVPGQLPVAAAHQQVVPQRAPPVAVHGDDDVHVLEK